MSASAHKPSVLRIFAKATKGSRWQVAGLMALMLISSLVEVGLIAISVTRLLRHVMNGQVVSSTSSIFVVLLISFLADIIAQMVRTPLREKVSHRIRHGLADEVEEVIKQAPRSIPRGSLASNTTNYLEAWVRFFDTITIQLVHFTSAFIIAIGIMAASMPILAAASILVFFGFGLISMRVSKPLLAKNEEATNAKATELRYLDVIVANDTDWIVRKLIPLRKAATQAVGQASYAYHKMYAIRATSFKFSIYLFQAISLLTIFAQLSQKDVSVPMGYLMLTTTTSFCAYLWTISVVITNLADALGLAGPMAKLVTQPRKKRQHCPPWLSTSPITIKKVVVAYRNEKGRITKIFYFENIELIEQFILLEGKNGSGKSTLLRAISHGDCEDGGVIEVKTKHGLKNLLGHDLEGQVVAVPQNLEKVSIPIATLFGLPVTEDDEFVTLPMMLERLDQATAERLLAALRGACIIADPEVDSEEAAELFATSWLDFMQEAGTLSGGQKRRLYLAAGLFEMLECVHRGAELVLGVLDEPSSEVDKHFVALLQERLKRFGANNPQIRFFFTAHDPATKSLADTVVWLNGPIYDRSAT